MGISKFLQSILPHKINNKNHYGKFTGSFEFIRLLSWNIFHPNRLINRLRWNTLFNYSKLKIKKYKKYISGAKLENDKLSNKLGLLIEDGGLIVNEYFDNQKIENFLNEYKNLIDSEKEFIENNRKENSKSNNGIYAYRVINLHLSNALIDIWLDDKVLQFLKHYLGQKIYAREYPRLIYTKYFFEDDLTSKDEHNGKYKNSDVKVPYFWHIDHSAGLISLHILLEDIDLNSTHMQYLPGSNKFLNSRDLYSDQTVANFKNEPVNCIGKKGTIYFHSGNTLHRVVGRKNSSRLGLIFSFSPGTNIEMDCDIISKAFSKNFKIDSLPKKKREVLKGIYPLRGGFDLKGNNLLNRKFNEQIE
tara:strand:- start:4431 stop:5510 length:1080 start_codon:yes stop_codon:yes gene_type:complete